MSLTDAYASAVAQFRSLRAEHSIAVSVALLEAQATPGIVLGRSAVEKNFRVEGWALKSWSTKAKDDAAAAVARKRWHAVEEIKGTWTGARDYARLWQTGIRPSYSAAIEKSVTQSG